MRAFARFVVLPPEISDFERSYLARVNRVALLFFALHLPVFMLIAFFNRTGVLAAALLTSAALAGPALAYFTLKNPRTVSVVYGIAAMFFGGVLVHLGQGPVQIEMHFYFFALLAMCAVFGNPMVILAAAVTVAIHHLVVWLVLPHSVFNYDAAWWVVAVHAAFVVLESIATVFIARSFFDNVIGLEKIVAQRTAEVGAKNRDMRRLLDNVDQGFLTIDTSGALAAERSAAIDGFFGAPAPGATWFDYLAAIDADFAARSRLGWDEVTAGIMPCELTLEQMPKRFAKNGAHYRVEYRPIGAAEPYERYLVVVTDVTTQVEAEQAETQRREALAIFERVLVDRSGFETFFEEATNIVEALSAGSADAPTMKRLLHTLKGNAALFGVASLASICHELESRVAETGEVPTRADVEPIAARWATLAHDMEKLLGKRSGAIEIDPAQYASLESAVKRGESGGSLLRKVRALRLEPTHRRLRHFAEQAERIAARLDKSGLHVAIEDHDVRLDARRWKSFWSAFVHAVRNAVDHGIESPESRALAGKPPEGTLALRTIERGGRFVVEVEDDGRGIDWDAVRDRACRIGLPAGSAVELERALFVDGMSTASSVTDVSGRGIGMGALLHATAAMGGEIRIESAPGKGTRLSMSFPLADAERVDSIAPHAAA